MTNKQDLFDARYRKVLKRHRQLSRGYVTRLGKNGIIDHYPIRDRSAVLPVKLVLTLGTIFFVFKAIMVALLGEEFYATQIALLATGSPGEEFGAFLMQIDPITRAIAQLLTSFVG